MREAKRPATRPIWVSVLAGAVSFGSPADAAELTCHSNNKQFSFLYSGTGGDGPAIFRAGDLRFRVLCEDFKCVGDGAAGSIFEGAAVGVALDMVPSPDQITLAIIGDRFSLSTVEVSCEVK